MVLLITVLLYNAKRFFVKIYKKQQCFGMNKENSIMTKKYDEEFKKQLVHAYMQGTIIQWENEV